MPVTFGSRLAVPSKRDDAPLNKFFSDRKAVKSRPDGLRSTPPLGPRLLRDISPPAIRRATQHTGPNIADKPSIDLSHVSHFDSTLLGARNTVLSHSNGIATEKNSLDADDTTISRSSPVPKTTVDNENVPFELKRQGSRESLRRHFNVDDGSSVASTSSRGSRAKNICRDCKQEGGEVRPLISCTACHRQYHSWCGFPSPASIKDGQKFVCGKCLRGKKIPPGVPQASASHTEEHQSGGGPALIALKRAADGPLSDSGFKRRNLGTDQSLAAGKNEETTDSVEASPEPAQVLIASSGPRLFDLRNIDRSLIAESTTSTNVEYNESVETGDPVTGRQAPVLDTVGGVQTEPLTRQTRHWLKVPGQTDSTSLQSSSTKTIENYPKESPTGRPQNVIDTPHALLRGEQQEQKDGNMYRHRASNVAPLRSACGADTDLRSREHAPVLANSASGRKPDHFQGGQNRGSELLKAWALRTAKEYKRLTCYHWRYSACNHENRPTKCYYAHRVTDVQEPGHIPFPSDKAFTCFGWKNLGVCRSGDHCRYSHLDTGLYVDAKGFATRAHITCPHWLQSRSGGASCWNGEKCRFAHQDTGIYVDRCDKFGLLQDVEGMDYAPGYIQDVVSQKLEISPHRVPRSMASPEYGRSGALDVAASLASPPSVTARSDPKAGNSPVTPIRGVDTPFSPVPSLQSQTATHTRQSSQSSVSDAIKPIERVSETDNKDRAAAPAVHYARRSKDPRLLAILERKKVLQSQNPPKRKVVPSESSNKPTAPSSGLDQTSPKMKSTNQSMSVLRKCENPQCSASIWGGTRCRRCQLAWKGGDRRESSPGVFAEDPAETTQGSLADPHAENTESKASAPSKDEENPIAKRPAPDDQWNISRKRAKPPTMMRGRLPSNGEMAPPREDQTRKLQSPPRTTSTANQDRSKAMVRANTDEESSRSSDKENRQPMTSPLLDERTTGTSEASLSASMQDTSQDWRPEEPTNLLIESSTSPKPFTCRNCRSHHKKCLHAKDGTYEPALCKAFLKDLGPAQKVNSRTKSEMQQIRGAAGKCSSAKTKPTTFLRHDDDSSISNNAETRLDPAQYSYETVEGVAEQSDDDEPIVAGRRRRAYAKQAGNSTVKPSAETANIEGEGCKDRGSSVVQSSVEPLPAGRTTVCKSPVATQVEETRSRKVSSLRWESLQYTSIKARANATRDAAAEAASPASAPEPNRAKTPPYQFLESSTLQPFPRPMVTATVERPGKDDQVDQVDVDISSVVSRLKDKGVVFEDDSSDDEVGESSSAREPAVLYPWQRKDISKDLYEIAPMLREISITDSTWSNFANTATSPRRSKKSAWRNLLHYQLQVRREKFGTEHPHRMVVARADSQKIKAVKLQDSTTQSWRHPLDPPQPEITQMTFDDFMGMPEDPIFEGKGGELVFRDGKREREWVASGAIRRTRNQGIDQRWHFMR